MKLSIVFYSGFFFFHIASAQPVSKFRIDPTQAYGGTVSEYFTDVEYIPLETTKESLFGDVLRMFITDSSFIVHDMDTKSILFFNKKGKYIRKIKGKTDEQFKITMDQEQNILIVTSLYPSSDEEKFGYYSVMGQPVTNRQKLRVINNKKKLMGLIALGNGWFVQLGNCLLANGQKPDLSKHYSLIDIVDGKSTVKQFLWYDQLNNLSFCVLAGYLSKPKVIKNGAFYINTPLDNYVYLVNKDTLVKKFQFVFPNDRVLPYEILNAKNMDSLRKIRTLIPDFDRRIITDVSNIFFNKNILFFKTNVTGYTLKAEATDSRFQYNFMYDTITNRLTSLERITPDSVNYYLPLRGFLTNMNGLDYQNEELYSTVSSLQMFAARAATKLKNPRYPSVLQEYFKTQNRKSNPVIVRMKLKE